MSRPSKSQPSQAATPDFHCAGVSSERRVASGAGDIGRGLYALPASRASALDRGGPPVEPWPPSGGRLDDLLFDLPPAPGRASLPRPGGRFRPVAPRERRQPGSPEALDRDEPLGPDGPAGRPDRVVPRREAVAAEGGG